VRRNLLSVAACALLVTLGGPSVAASYGAAQGATGTGEAHVTLAGPCRGPARYELDIDRTINESGNPDVAYALRVYGTPGDKWRYKGLLRLGSARFRDHGVLTVGPGAQPHWGASLRLVTEHARPFMAVRVRGEGPSGQLCRTTFTQRLP